jgi:hypothetical protein
LLIVEDVILGAGGAVLLPAVERGDLRVRVGDFVDILAGDYRRAVQVIALEPDADGSRVRLRVAALRPLRVGAAIWERSRS